MEHINLKTWTKLILISALALSTAACEKTPEEKACKKLEHLMLGLTKEGAETDFDHSICMEKLNAESADCLLQATNPFNILGCIPGGLK